MATSWVAIRPSCSRRTPPQRREAPRASRASIAPDRTIARMVRPRVSDVEEQRRVAGRPAGGVARHLRNAAPVDADSGEGAPRPDAADQSLLARDALRHIARADDVA